MTNEGKSVSFVPKETNHCHGSFPAINVGVSLGPGDNKPRRVSVGKHDEMVQRLLNDGDVQRFASHQDGRWPIHEICQPDADLKATIASFKATFIRNTRAKHHKGPMSVAEDGLQRWQLFV